MTKLPLSVDLEAGYSRDPIIIAQQIKQLANLDVVGINLEDSIVDKEQRRLVDAEAFAKTITIVKEELKKQQVKIFLNVRTDTFLLGVPDTIQATKKRIQAYEKAGADGIFLPCIVKEADIKVMVTSINLPINVMCMPNLPTFEKLTELGVKHISMGNFLFEAMQTDLQQKLATIQQQQSFNPIFEHANN